jgi:hypothetical protein
MMSQEGYDVTGGWKYFKTMYIFINVELRVQLDLHKFKNLIYKISVFNFLHVIYYSPLNNLHFVFV